MREFLSITKSTDLESDITKNIIKLFTYSNKKDELGNSGDYRTKNLRKYAPRVWSQIHNSRIFKKYIDSKLYNEIK